MWTISIDDFLVPGRFLLFFYTFLQLAGFYYNETIWISNRFDPVRMFEIFVSTKHLFEADFQLEELHKSQLGFKTF